MKPSWLIAFVVCGAVPGVLAQVPPEPGAAATPGQSNPQRADPSTATPSTVSPPITRPRPQDSQSPRSDNDMSTAADRRPKVGREAMVGGLAAGSVVQSPAGEPVGLVKDVVPDTKTGDPAYIVISARGGNVAVPYEVVAPMYQNGHVVLDRSRLESAPHVNDSQLRDEHPNAAWMKEADRYWQSHKPPTLQ